MPTDNPKAAGTDLLGLAPYGEALNTGVKGLLDGAGAFLGKLCLPAAEEFGLLLQDRVRRWRAVNAASMLAKAEDRQIKAGEDGYIAHPRLVDLAVRESSWTDSDSLQDLWSGLLQASAISGQPSDNNLMFMNALKQMSHTEAVLMALFVDLTDKRVFHDGTVGGSYTTVSFELARTVTGNDDLSNIRLSVEHLEYLRIVESSYSDADSFTAQPTAFGCSMVVCCRGSRLNPVEFYGLAGDDRNE